MAYPPGIRDWVTIDTPAIHAARDYGIDLTLLVENLRRTPTERLRKAESFFRLAFELRGIAQRRAAGIEP